MIEDTYLYKSTLKSLIDKGFDAEEGDDVTHSLAMKWLRDEKKINIDVDYLTETNNYSFYIKPMKGCKDWFEHVKGSNTYKTWEICAEMGILYVIEKLL